MYCGSPNIEILQNIEILLDFKTNIELSLMLHDRSLMTRYHNFNIP